MPREKNKRCIFCESAGPFNEEHCVDQWLEKWLLKPADVLRIIRGGADYGRVQEWMKDDNEHVNMVTRAVCRDICNGGWIRQLGEECEPLLGPMLDGYEQVLYPEMARVLARWAIKVAATHDSSFFPEGRQIDAEWCRRIFQMRDNLPNEIVVWVGRYVGHRLVGCWTHRLRPFISPGMDTSPVLGFCSLVVVGEVLFHIIGVKEDKDLPTAFRTAASRPFIRIWPPPDGIERWPLREIWGDDSILTLCQRQLWGGDPVARPGPRLWVPPYR